MKKLLFVLVIVGLSVTAFSASIDWSSGTMRRAESKDGGWMSSGGIKNYLKTDTTLLARLYLVDFSAYDAATKQSISDLYASYNTKAATVSASVAKGESNVVTPQTTGATVGTDYYAVLLYNYTDQDYGEMYMASFGQIAGTLIDNPSSTYTVSTIAANAKGGPSWQAVPEPFSGTLALLGMAGIALRRKLKKAKKA